MNADPLYIPSWVFARLNPSSPSYNPDQVRDRCEQVIRDFKKSVDAIKSASDAATFENTVGAMSAANNIMMQTLQPVICAGDAGVDDATAAIYRDITQRLSEVETEIFQDSDLYARFGAVARPDDELKMRLLDKKLKNFKDTGAHLPPSDAKDELAKLINRSSQLTQDFMEVNTANALVTLPFTLKELSGASAELLEQLEDAEPGVKRVPANPTLVDQLLEGVSSREVRQRLFELTAARGTGENPGDVDTSAITAEHLQVRARMAEILGYQSYAALSLNDQMAATPATVAQVLADTWPASVARAQKALDKIQDFAPAAGVNSPVQPWDILYLQAAANAHAAQMPSVTLQSAMDAAMAAAQRIFGVQFEKVPYSAYHADTVTYRVMRNGRLEGHMLFDMFARDTKQPGAWMNHFAIAAEAGGKVLPAVSITLSAPAAPGDFSCAMPWSDVTTVFHEMGHAMHGILGKTGYVEMSGTNVAGDFVELPSTLFERQAIHPESAKIMFNNNPDALALIQAAERRTELEKDLFQPRMLRSAILDMRLHAPDFPQIAGHDDVTALPPWHQPAHFSHIFAGGYAAGYYSYLWADILASQLHAVTDHSDDKTLSEAYQKLYSAGDAHDLQTLFDDVRNTLKKPKAPRPR